MIADALWVLRQVLAFSRANGLVPPGFDPTEGLVAPAPDAAARRGRRPWAQPRPLDFAECARIAAHLHPVHQLVLWLQRVMGLRISEAFGVLVDDVIDLGDTGRLLVRGQGGRPFKVRDDQGTVVAVTHKERLKTEAASRALVLPSTMLALLRVTVEAFHTDPETEEIDETSRLVPGLRTADYSGQLSFRETFETAAAAEGLSSGDLGFRVSPHLLRKSVATDLAWQPGIEGAVRRRFMGHRAADDVFGRVYTLDHPELTPLTEVPGCSTRSSEARSAACSSPPRGVSTLPVGLVAPNVLTKSLLRSIPALYSTEDTPCSDKTLWVHYFLGGRDWYLEELDLDTGIAFSYCSGVWGYVNLVEMEAVVSGFAIIERDLDFEPTTVRKLGHS